MDVQKQIDYWRNGAEEDLAAAGDLLDSGRVRHSLFFAELALEKVLKGLVVKETREVPPKIHDLLRLAHLAAIPLSVERRSFLARFQEHCLAGRYPEELAPVPSRGDAKALFEECREAIEWLKSLF